MEENNEFDTNDTNDEFINSFNHSKKYNYDRSDNIHNSVYNIMTDFRNYINDYSIPLLEYLEYLYLFDYIEEVTKD